MKLAIGILLLFKALWLLYGTIRMWPPGRHRPGMLWPSTRADIVRGVFLIVATCGPGVALIRGASWWWLLVAGIAFVIWVMAEGRTRRGALEEGISRNSPEVQEGYIKHDEERQEILAFLARVTPINILQQEIAHNVPNAHEGLPKDQYDRIKIMSDRLESLDNNELGLLNRLNELSPPNSCIGVVDKWVKASQLRLKCYPLMQQSLRTDDKRIAEQLLGYSTEVDKLHRAAEKELRQLCAEHNILMTILNR